MTHYVYFANNPLVRAGRVTESEWIVETREHWLSDEWMVCFAGGCGTKTFTLEVIEEMFSSPKG